MDMTIIAFGFYVMIIGCISWWSYTKTTDPHVFMLGNRSLNHWATAIATHSTDMSIWLFTGFPGAVYLYGISTIWVPIGLLGGMFFTWRYIAKQLRVATEKYNSFTLSSYLEHRFNDTKGNLRIISALFAFIFFIFYIASGLVGVGRMFESVFNINYHFGIIIGLIITIGYTIFGGFIGIALCDLFQGIFLASMIVFVPLWAYFHMPNSIGIVAAAHLKNISFAPFISYEPYNIFIVLLTAISWGLGYFGQPHILVNFMGIKDPETMPKAMRLGMIWQIFTLGSAMAIGLLGIQFFINPLSNNELVFIDMVQQLFTPFSAGLILCAILAAGLTTIDTQILVTSSIISHDIYKKYIHKNASNEQELFISKLMIIIIPMISFMIAISGSNSVYGLVEYAWTGLGATFGPLMITSLNSNRITQKGALMGMIFGGTISSIWFTMNSDIPAMIPAFLGNLIIIFLTRSPKNTKHTKNVVL